MPRRIAIIQSCYIPWRGYFAAIAQCDAFVFLDSVQFTRRDWRTRNRIKTPQGPIWLSIPVRQKGNSRASIDSIEVAGTDWVRTHLRSIEANYRRAPHFATVFPLLESAYENAASQPLLSDVNQTLIAAICKLLDIATPLLRDVDLVDRAALAEMAPTSRLIELAVATQAKAYFSGPAAQAYLDEAAFAARNIAVEWIDYACLAGYPQQWGDFDPALSIVDALLNLGPREARVALGV